MVTRDYQTSFSPYDVEISNYMLRGGTVTRASGITSRVRGRAVSRRVLLVCRCRLINIALDPAELGQGVGQMKAMLSIYEVVHITSCPVELCRLDAGE